MSVHIHNIINSISILLKIIIFNVFYFTSLLNNPTKRIVSALIVIKQYKHYTLKAGMRGLIIERENRVKKYGKKEGEYLNN